MESILKNITLREASDLIEKIKNNSEYTALVKELQYFVDLQSTKFTNEVLQELQELISRINKLLELDAKIKEKEDIVNLFVEISHYFKEQEIRQEDLENIKNGEIFKIVEELDCIDGKKEKDLDLVFITRYGADKYKKEHKNEYEGILKIKVIDNKDELLEKILRLIEKNY